VSQINIMPNRHSKRKANKQREEKQKIEARRAEIRQGIKDTRKRWLQQEIRLKKIANEFLVARASNGSKRGDFTLPRAVGDLSDVQKKYKKIMPGATYEQFKVWVRGITQSAKGGQCTLRKLRNY